MEKALTLGEKLAATQNAIVETVRVAEAKKVANHAAKLAKDNETVNNFIIRAKTYFINAINNGQVPKGFKIPKGAPYNTESWNSRNNMFLVPPTHPQYEQFVGLVKWAENNGLKINFKHETDDNFMRGWYELQVSVA